MTPCPADRRVLLTGWRQDADVPGARPNQLPGRVLLDGMSDPTDASPDGSPGGLPQLWIQCQGVAATLVYSGIGTLILLMITKVLVGLRVGEEEEREGLDLVLHGEQIF